MVVQDPFAFLASVGVLEKVSARPVLKPWLREVLGDHYFETRPLTVEEVRELWRPYMQPGEKLSDLVIKMREE